LLRLKDNNTAQAVLLLSLGFWIEGKQEIFAARALEEISASGAAG
jgi:hypothetical protein